MHVGPVRIAKGGQMHVEPAVQVQGSGSPCGEIAHGAQYGEVSGCVPGLWWEVGSRCVLSARYGPPALLHHLLL